MKHAAAGICKCLLLDAPSRGHDLKLYYKCDRHAATHGCPLTGA